MKFKLLGDQESHLNATDHFGTLEHDRYDARTGPVNGVLDWSEKDLLHLAAYCQIRGEALAGPGVDGDPYTRSEIRSLFALARRIRKAVAKAEATRLEAIRSTK